MDRRGFFRTAFRRTAQEAVKQIDARASSAAQRWIRPPYAIDELEFLLACSRCGDCSEACPHGLVFPLSVRVGTTVVGTPALDLLNRGCQLCDGWPCVAACDKGALLLPEPEVKEEPPPLPTLAQATINKESCLPYSGPECGACEGSCPVPGALTWEQQRPVINAARCVGCGCCREACCVDPKAIDLSARGNDPAEGPSEGGE